MGLGFSFSSLSCDSPKYLNDSIDKIITDIYYILVEIKSNEIKYIIMNTANT